MRKLAPILLSSLYVMSCTGKPEQDITLYSDTNFFVDPSIQSGMMIQRNTVFPISGTGTPGGKIKITCSWEDEADAHEITIPDNGEWTENINTPEATGENLTISVQEAKTTVFDYILAGDIWLCCGQSNMYWPLKDAERGTQEAAAATNKQIRLLDMERTTSDKPENDFSARWKICNPEDAENFSAVGYFFGKTLFEETGVPVGLIGSNWGNTGIEVWIDRNKIMADNELAAYAKLQESTPHTDGSPHTCGSAYNAMIYPLSRYPVKGAILYQGENNQGTPYIYPKFMKALTENWRELWGNEMPFYIAQICPYQRIWDFATNYSNPAMRYMQAVAAETIEGCAAEVNDDVGDTMNIHPRKKKEVGERLAWLALDMTYGMHEFSELRCPMFDKTEIESSSITVHFKYAEQGLTTSDGQAPSEFEIAGEDRIFYPAQARTEGNKVVLNSENVQEPVFARLGWSYVKTTNLRSAAGLPVSVFKNYDWEEPEEEK